MNIQEHNAIAHVIPELGRVQTISEHLRGVIQLAEENCPLNELKSHVMLAALFHDVGKLGQEFQDFMLDVLKNGNRAQRRFIDHSTAGGRILEKYASIGPLTEFISYAVYSHHGLSDGIDLESGESLFEKRRGKEIEEEKILEEFLCLCKEAELKDYLEQARSGLEKIVSILHPFLGKKESRSEEYFYLGMYERLILSVLIDSDWMDTSCFYSGEEYSKRNSGKLLWTQAESQLNCFLKRLQAISPLDACRQEISEICLNRGNEKHRLYRLTVPTGAGKTLSSLRFALRQAKVCNSDHIFYVAPFNSILEQNAEEIRKAVGDNDLVLEHHCNVILEEAELAEQYQKMADRWDAPIIATSAVQMLNALFSESKNSIRKMYNLCNSVIVFDEVQAIPTKCTELFNLAINFLTRFCNTTVVLCSATQPSVAMLQKNNLIGCKEMVQDIDGYEKTFKRSIIEDCTKQYQDGMSADDAVNFILDKYEKYGSILFIVNTTECAARLFKELQNRTRDQIELYHLSTRMCPKHRRDTLSLIGKRLKENRPLVCISTQLIEAGVNLSFPCVIRSLAGLDNVIQAAGRCNRHREAETGHVFIVQMKKELENVDYLKEICRAQTAMWKVLDLFRKNPEAYQSSLTSQLAIRAYYAAYFADPTKCYTEYPYIKGFNTTLEEMLGKNNVGVAQFERKHGRGTNKPCLRQAFATAGKAYRVIEESTKMSLVIAYDQRASMAISYLDNPKTSYPDKKRALRVLQQYSVGVPEYFFGDNAAYHSTAEGTILVLNMDYYDNKLGVLKVAQNYFLNF